MNIYKKKIISLSFIVSMIFCSVTIEANGGNTKKSIFSSSFVKKTALLLGTAGFFGLMAYCCNCFYKKSRGLFSTRSILLPKEKREAISRELLLACKNGDLKQTRTIMEKHNIKRRTDSLARENKIECYRSNIFITEIMDEKNRSALYLACKSGNLELIMLLAGEIDSLGIGKGGEKGPVKEFDSKKTIFEVACECDNPEIFKFLVNTFLKNVNKEDPGRLFCGTPLHIACRYGKLELVKWLVEKKGANIHVKIGGEGSTPIYIASQKGYLEIVKYLVSRDSDPKKIVKRDLSSVHVACKNGHSEMVKYFVEEIKIPVNFANYRGKTLVHFAAGSDNLELFKFLAKKDRTLINKSSTIIWYENRGKLDERIRKKYAQKETPLAIAKKKGRTEIAEWILKKIEQ